MAIKELKTRIALKYDSYTNWTDDTKEGLGANLVLLKGEIGICEIPSGNNNATTAPTVLFKVGDGEKPFKSLKWASALAADVYGWAKASDVVVDGKNIKFVGGAVDADGNKVDKVITLAFMNETDVKAITDPLAAKITALEGKFTGTGSVQSQIDALDGRLDVIEGEAAGSIKKAEADAKAYAKDYADGLAGNYDASGSAATAEQNAKDYANGLDEAMGKRVDDVAADLSAHIADKENPHEVTKAQVGLSEVDNKSVATIKSEFTGAVAADDTGFVTGGAAYTAIEAAKTAANTYADSLNTAMDTRVDALEAAKTAQDTTNENLTKAIADEKSARETAVSDEATARDNADKAINAKIGTVAEGKTVVKMIEEAQAAAEATAASDAAAKVKALEDGKVATNASEISRVEGLVTAEVKAREDADKAIDERLDAVEAFFATTEGETLDTALDTLKEIQDYLNGEGEATGGILSRVAQAETDIDNLEKEFNTETGRVTVAEKAIDAVEADLSDYKTTVTNALAGKQDVIPENTYDAYGSAANVKAYVDGDFKTAIEGYADGKASAAQTAAEKTASDALATAVQTINAKDSAQDTEIGKKLDKTTFESHTTGDHAKTATEITAEIAAAVLVEENARKAADTAIEEKIGGSYSKTSTVADAIAGVKTTADNTAADLATLTGDSGRVKAAENAIDALELIVNDASKGNEKLRTDVNALQTLTGDAAKGNAALHTELTRVAGLVENTTTGLAATKAIADQNKTDIGTLNGKVTAIENDYVKASDLVGDFYVFNCGTSTTVTHVVPEN